MSPYLVAWLAASVGLVPLAWLLALRGRGHRRDVALWWLAAAFAVSFLADAVAFFLPPQARWVTSVTYPVSQAALIGFVFLLRRDQFVFLATLLVVGVIAVLWRGARGPDILLSTVAYGGVTGIVLDRWELGRLRTALLVSFGLGLVAWWGYALVPGWWTWGIYQGVRALGAALFCAACTRPVDLRLARAE